MTIIDLKQKPYYYVITSLFWILSEDFSCVLQRYSPEAVRWSFMAHDAL